MASDRDILRGLAGAVAERAALPVQQERIAAWTRNNDLQPNRPMVYMAEAEMPWQEIAEALPDEVACQCVDPSLHGIETSLRRRLFIADHLDTDHVVDDVYWVEKKIRGMDYGIEVQEQTIDGPNAAVSAHHYDPVITGPEDVDKIQLQDVAYDEAATLAEVQRLDALFGDLLPVKICGKRSHTFNAWDTIVCWTGIQEALMDLALRPEYCHALIRRLTDVVLARMDRLEELGLLDAPLPKHTVGSGAAAFISELPQDDCDGEHFRHCDIWGSSTSQIFSEVSPDMHGEFAIAYENETLSRCGLSYYGCCEPLHTKMAQLDAITNLRKVSISPWCDTRIANDNATRAYVFSHKPNPAMFAAEQFDPAAAEAELRQRIENSEGMNCEIIAKDISTARGDVQRLIDWTRIAMRVARSYE